MFAVAAAACAGLALAPRGHASVRTPERPVSTVTPAATAKLWRQLVDRPQTAQRAADCRPLRAVFYAATDWLRLATKLAANASQCAEYYISIPPLVSDKKLLKSVFDRIAREHDDTRAAFFEITQTKTLLENNPSLALSLRNRIPYIDPLSHL